MEDVGVHLEAHSREKLEWLLDAALAAMEGGRTVWRDDPLLRVIVKELVGGTRLAQYRHILEEYRTRGVKVLTYWDEDYPERLREVSRPPLVLYVQGEVFPGDSHVALVGTRRASSRGLELAYRFARFFAEHGRTVVSGLARGIDAEAHRGAIDGGGTTLAVLAGHLDHIYPREHLALAKSITLHGALVSEVTHQVPLYRLRFVERNRITSGLARAVVIVESRQKGGTMQQARFALSQGRRLYVVDHGKFEYPEAAQAFDHLKDLGGVPVSDPGKVQLLETGRLDQHW